MREIVLDTETTGLDPAAGHRIVEIGAVELFNQVPTGRVFHQYINPERPMPREALEVHGLDDAFLRDKPVFAAIAGPLLDFIEEAPLVIHNAGFDIAFLNAELARLGRPALAMTRCVNTLDLARRRFPGAQASLDALCKRFAVDCTARTLHGALLDSHLLAEVYLELLGGRQRGLGLAAASATLSVARSVWVVPVRPRALAPRLTAEERAAHAAFIAELGPSALWHRRLEDSAPSLAAAAAAM
jgi:DNA polymerase-3 subunit epsilon